MAVEILVRLDDEAEALPLDQLTWEHVAPCGCTCGVMVADTPDREAAFKHFLPNVELRKRDVADGYLFRLARRDLVLDRFRVRCTCTPRWGVEKLPIPDGYRWGEVPWSGQRRRLHLVAVAADTKQHGWIVIAERLCDGARGCYSAGWLGDLPTCRKCEKQARARAADAHPPTALNEETS